MKERANQGATGVLAGRENLVPEASCNTERGKVPSACIQMKSPAGDIVDDRCDERGHMINERAFEYYSRLTRVRQHVERNYADRLPLALAASIAAMEATYFSTFFHKKVGIRYSDWLRQIRISKAMELIRTTDRSLSEIAYAVGFQDLRTFERGFKKIVQMTPREYKKTVQA